MDSLVQDVRYAIRVLLKAPAFATVTVLTLALGTGANATVFSFVSALLLRPAPGVADPSSLVSIFTSDFSSGPYGDSSYPDYLSLRSETTAFSGMAAADSDSTTVARIGGTVERVRVSSVTGEYFQVLGVKPAAGRLVVETDTAPDAPPVAVIAHRIWRRTYAESPTAIGSTVMLNTRAFTVVGVAAEEFEGLGLGARTDVWTPMVPTGDGMANRGTRGLSVIARLRPASTVREARAQVSAMAARLAAAYPDTNLGTLGAPDAPRPVTALPHTRLGPEFRGMVTTLGAILMTAVGLVLLIACANIASLLLSRATARDREMAVRLALGAGRGRVVRQLLTESLLLGLAGGAVGLLFALWTADLLPSFFPAEQATLIDTRVDLTVIAFIAAVSLISSLAFGLAPALHAASPQSATALRSGASRVSDGPIRTRMRRVLVASQVALAMVLLIGAGLLTRSVVNGLAADTGFATRDALLASVEIPDAENTPGQGLLYYEAALERVRSRPGVLAAAVVRTLPTSRMSRRGFRIDGYQPQPGEGMEQHINTVGHGYFETLQVPVLAGRTFDGRDRPDGAPVVIVNSLLAERYLQGRAVGRRLRDSRGTDMEIVGVVANTVGLTVQSGPVPTVYYPLVQNYSPEMTFVVRTAGEPLAMAETVRRELTAVDRNVPVFRTTTLSSHMAEASADSRLTAALVGACGAMALLLATIGVYGVIAFGVARRTREIGVRIALGARPWHIVQLVLNEGVAVTLAGIVLGLAWAAVSTRALESLLYGVQPSDPLTWVAVPAVLALVAVLAACVPARRALRVEPHAVLRQE